MAERFPQAESGFERIPGTTEYVPGEYFAGAFYPNSQNIEDQAQSANSTTNEVAPNPVPTEPSKK